MKAIFFLFFSTIIYTCNNYTCAQGKSNETILDVSLIGKEYDNLYLRIVSDSWGKIEGLQLDKYKWQFTIPDSTYEKAIVMRIAMPSPDSIYHDISFRIFDNNSMEYQDISDFVPDKRYCRLEGEYIETRTSERVAFMGNKRIASDYFMLKNISDNETFMTKLEELKERTSSYKLPYDQKVERSFELYKKYNSQVYISMLSNELSYYKSKKDVQMLFNCFSDSLKQTPAGMKIREYLNLKIFPNEKLISNDSNKEEDIIQDSTKYNLVIFSASWCAPCHKVIPLLKEVYQDLNKEIIFTYITIDESSYIDKWVNLMNKEQIPWRSLRVKDKNMKHIKDMYFVSSIPLTYLVYPDKRFEPVDIRKADDKRKLYDLSDKVNP